mmetsp:Transcript_8668/g.35352  ORF Transcript_8668/g.35352 Transcript_8668/m.35352 type:complete len:259 (+) Transcript_8668:1044-1820(+)
MMTHSSPRAASGSRPRPALYRPASAALLVQGRKEPTAMRQWSMQQTAAPSCSWRRRRQTQRGRREPRARALHLERHREEPGRPNAPHPTSVPHHRRTRARRRRPPTSTDVSRNPLGCPAAPPTPRQAAPGMQSPRESRRSLRARHSRAPSSFALRSRLGPARPPARRAQTAAASQRVRRCQLRYPPRARLRKERQCTLRGVHRLPQGSPALHPLRAAWQTRGRRSAPCPPSFGARAAGAVRLSLGRCGMRSRRARWRG